MSAFISRRWQTRILLGASLFAIASVAFASTGRADPGNGHDGTATPIKHLIVVIGENRSFDHVFATYVPKSGDGISNLLSKGIINADGSPGPHFAEAQQFQATAPFRTGYYISLGDREKAPYATLPLPGLNFSPTGNEPATGAAFAANGVIPPFLASTPASLLAAIEPSLDADDLALLTTGANGLNEPPPFNLADEPDSRIANFNALADGPFPLRGAALPYDSYTGDTTHRLFEMWQQSDCSIAHATEDNPSGCLNDLYPFVITSYTGPTDNGGSNSMAFYNVQQGDAPILKQLADEYSMSDNYHQPAMGGTAMQHIYLGSGDSIFWSDGHGNAVTPPSHIANPNPMSGTDNQYIVDANFDGNLTNCSDHTQPGIDPILDYLAALPWHPASQCAPSHFYMINNNSPGFLPDGTIDTNGIAKGSSMPPSNVRTIGEALNERDISWAYYGGAYNAAVALTKNPTSTDATVQIGQTYCNICNFESYASAIMGNPSQRVAHIKDATDFFAALASDDLPSIAFIKPDSLLDGHPASSKVDLFEGMVENILDQLQQHPDLVADTAVLITVDEGGGYYDSGYIQPLDFFGDGPRIPLIVVSPFSRGGHISHSYTDHVSILKFIERNWRLQPLTDRSRDNLPNPQADRENPYVPVNSPAIGDLFDLFDFGQHGHS
ncbi:MAG TPA: alkaline phosphatase family protein [Stellaceae bacterium]|jgi:phospholipase C|nr:alkaline phosphatase family protein [Stellaceae bacterium]